MKKLLYLLVVISTVFASCSGKKYGHYRYSKKQKHTTEKHKSQRAKKVKNIKPEYLSVGKPSVSQNINSDSVQSKATALLPHTQRLTSLLASPKNNDTILKAQNHKAQVILEQSNTEPENPIKNKNANLAFILSLVGLGLSLLGIFSPFISTIGFISIVLGFIFGLIALSEIKKNPSMYSNKGEAITAVVIGAVYLALLVIATLLILLVIVLLGGL